LKLTRAIVVFVGVALAAVGGVVAYRAAFVRPPSEVVISDEGVHELHDRPRILGGLALLFAGAGLAFYAARRRAH
jgi:hypothetical protein